MEKIKLLDPQQSIRLSKAVLAYLISVSPRSLYLKQIIDHYPHYHSRDITRSLRWLYQRGLVRQMASLFYSTDAGRDWATKNISQTQTDNN